MNAPRLTKNPFHVLGVPPSVDRMEAERAGQKLLALIDLGHASTAEHASPIGPRPLSGDDVRLALSALRDPTTRVMAEAAYLPPAPAPKAEPPIEWAAIAARLSRRRPFFP